MKCPACGAQLVKIKAETKLGEAEMWVCPSGAHYFIKVPLPKPAT